MKLEDITNKIIKSYKSIGDMSHITGRNLPSRKNIAEIVEDLLCLLFPGFFDASKLFPKKSLKYLSEHISLTKSKIQKEIEKGLQSTEKLSTKDVHLQSEESVTKLFTEIPNIRDLLHMDIKAFYEGDPAATCHEEVIVAYPGLNAIAIYRLAHVLNKQNIPIVPRMMCEYAHSKTGIDIHPGAKIGSHFFIDHGTGVVIGETCTIGNNVIIYQGVTLGSKSFPKDPSGRIIKGIKRHPDIEDNVTIYSGATILGDIEVGKNSIIGGNVWLTHTVPANTKIFVSPPQEIKTEAYDYQI